MIDIEFDGWETWKKTILVAKKRINNVKDNISEIFYEQKMQKKAYDITQKYNLTIWVPKIYNSVLEKDWKQLFVFMDFIEGKTIWLKIMEKYLYYKEGEEYDFKRDTDCAVYIYDTYVSWSQNFDNITKKIYQEYWNSFDKFSEDLKKIMYVNYFVSYYDKPIYENIMFSKEDFFNVDDLNVFVTLLHANWMTHWDLQDNVRNIMIDCDWKPYVIDFGLSVEKNHTDYNKGVENDNWAVNIYKNFYIDPSRIRYIEDSKEIPEDAKDRMLDDYE